MKVYLFSILLILIAYEAEVRGECPSIDDIPLKPEDTGPLSLYTCAQFWEGLGDDFYVDACNGESHMITDGDDWSDPTDFNYYYENKLLYPMGSLAVMPGCTLFMYAGMNYDRSRKKTEIKGPNFNFDNTWGHRPDDDSLGHGPSSLKCRCVQTPPSCDPEDGFDVVLICDNTRGMVDVSCTYSHTVGTSYSEEMEEGFSASASVESHMQSDFFGLFSMTLDVSANTGYNWSDVTDTTKEEETTIIVDATAPAGLVLVVEQAVGHCGDSVSRTEMFQISHYNSTGHLASWAKGVIRDGAFYQIGETETESFDIWTADDEAYY